MLSLKACKTDCFFSSMGIDGGEKHSIDDLSIKIAMEFGVDLSKHNSQKFELKKLQDADLILVMDNSQMQYIKAMCYNVSDKLYFFMDYPKKRYFFSSIVDDPYKRSAKCYKNVYAKIFNNVQKIVELQNE